MQAVIIIKARMRTQREFDGMYNPARKTFSLSLILSGDSIACFERTGSSSGAKANFFISPKPTIVKNFLGNFLPMIHTCKFYDK